MSALVLTGDAREALAAAPSNSIDAVVTDPPYGLSKEPDALEVLRHWLAGDDYEHTGGGFMGKTWDSFVPGPSIWREVFRVLKPGGHACVFAGSRTVDLMGLSLRIAGFEIRDQLQWLYGTGFPKSLNAGRAIDMKRCSLPGRHYDKTLPKGNKARPGDHLCPEHPDGDPHRGKGTALKPAHEPIVLARKPLIGTVAANVLEYGTGGINVEGCRIGSEARHNPPVVKGWQPDGTYTKRDAEGKDVTGRWPANVILDPEAGAMLDEQSGITKSPKTTGRGAGGQHGITSPRGGQGTVPAPGDTGGASRFFYCAKASGTEREAGLDAFRKATAGELTGGRAEGSAGLDNPRAGAGRKSSGRANVHPTVKPIALMRWLVRLVTPPGGIVLDPFTGSGSTGCAASAEGFGFLGVELSEEYAEIARARIAHWSEK